MSQWRNDPYVIRMLLLALLLLLLLLLLVMVLQEVPVGASMVLGGGGRGDLVVPVVVLVVVVMEVVEMVVVVPQWFLQVPAQVPGAAQCKGLHGYALQLVRGKAPLQCPVTSCVRAPAH